MQCIELCCSKDFKSGIASVIFCYLKMLSTKLALVLQKFLSDFTSLVSSHIFFQIV